MPLFGVCVICTRQAPGEVQSRATGGMIEAASEHAAQGMAIDLSIRHYPPRDRWSRNALVWPADCVIAREPRPAASQQEPTCPTN